MQGRTQVVQLILLLTYLLTLSTAASAAALPPKTMDTRQRQTAAPMVHDIGSN